MAGGPDDGWRLWHAEFRHYRPLIERIIAQTERRVLQGEAIPAKDNSIGPVRAARRHHRPSTGREVQYDHKLNLTTDRIAHPQINPTW